MASVLISDLIPVMQQPGFMLGMEEERKKLLQLFTAILHRLPEAEHPGLLAALEEEELKEVETWFRHLMEAAYNADDVLDEFRYAKLRAEAEAETNRHQSGNKVRTNIFSLCKLITGMRLRPTATRPAEAQPFKGLTGIMGDLVERSTHFISPQGQGLIMPCSEGLQDPTLSSLKVTDVIIVGRDEEKEQIVHQLLHMSNSVGGTIPVLPIIAPQGSGKSALARFICDDARIKNHYDSVLWVNAIGQPNIARIAKSVIDMVTGNDCCLSEDDMDLLEYHINQELSGKRFLLVLDDVYHCYWNMWEQLISCIGQSGATGSSIIVTSHDTSQTMQWNRNGERSPMCILSPLTKDDLWNLFCRRVFIVDKEICPEMHEIGEQIVERCNGLPLLVNLMGGLMRFKKDLVEWQQVIHQMKNCYSKYDDPIGQIIKICYYNLSSEIKECFAFCSVFPEGLYMDKEVLIKLWMANGLISSNGTISIEEKGNRIFNELALRHFLEDVKLVPGSSSRDKHEYRSRVICKVHGSIYALELFSRNENAVLPECSYIPRHVTSSLKVRFLFVASDSPVDIHLLVQLYPHVRTLIFSDGPFERTINRSRPSKNNSLRALHLHSVDKWWFHQLQYAKYLRYLDLSGSRIEVLSKFIGLLYFLQTLNLSKCLLLRRLPKDMRYMRSLRHLYIHECPKLRKMPVYLSQLSFLQTLTTYIVGESAGNGIDEIKYLDLGGLLEIYNLHKVKNAANAKEARLFSKMNLERLTLCWGRQQLVMPKENNVSEMEGREQRDARKDCGGPRGACDGEADCRGAQEGVTPSTTPFYAPQVTPDSTPPTMTEDETNTDADASEQEDELFYTPRRSFCSDEGGDNEADSEEKLYLEVLMALRPHIGLKVLKIQQYGGHKFAKWLANPVDLPNLVELHLVGCSQCMTIPAVWKLRSLRVLCLKHSNFTSFLGIDEKDSLELFRSLKRLVLVGLKRLKRWHQGEAMQKTILSFSVLDEMDITNCPELKTMPSVPVLKYLTIRESHGLLRSAIDLITQSESLVEVNMTKASGSDNEILSALGTEVDGRNSQKLRVMRLDSTNGFFMNKAIPHLHLDFWRSMVSLENLDIFNCSSIVAWPLEELKNLGKLKRLTVRMCPNLTGLLPSQLQEREVLLPLLQSLEFYRCPSLKEIPKCSSILYLELDECSEIKSISGGLNNLRMLFLSCTNWTSLPTGLENLEKLKSLQVSECYSLTSLPDELACLTSLQTLTINKCPRLECLPKDLGQMLSSLEKLQISECISLKEIPRCSSILNMKLDECDRIKSISGLNKLRILFLSCSSWKSLPTGFKDLKKLESLQVSKCYRLTSLPNELASLTSLQTLIINDCYRIKSLPKGLGQMLSGLENLQISNCSELKKFCKRNHILP